MGRRYAPVIAAARTAWRHSPPGTARGALSLSKVRFVGFGAESPSRPPAESPASAPSQPLRHLFQNLPLVGRQTLDPVLRDLVEHTIELVSARFPSARRWRHRHSSLRGDRFALRDDVV